MNEDLFCAVKSLSYEFPYSDYLKATIELVGNDPRIFKQFDLSSDNPFNGIRFKDDEFMCMWCGSPNPITNRHCSQCGGARGFIIK